MIPELGLVALILALCLSVLQGVLPLWGAQTGRRAWIALARPAAQASFLAMLTAFLALAWCFYSNDFSVLYVSQNSNAQLPTPYRLSAVWGGHEGSLLLWVFMLAGWAVAVAQFSRTLDEAMVARVLGVLGLVMTGLLLFILFTSGGSKAGLHFSYLRYIENRLREEFDFFATPIRLKERHKTRKES